MTSFFGAPTTPQPRPRKVSRSKSRYAALPDSRRITAIRQRAYTPRPAVALDLDAKRPRRSRPAWASVRDQARSAANERGRMAALAFARAPQSVCVRTCDGYVFPLGRLKSDKDMPLHKAACAAAWPNAPTVLYRLPSGRSELEQAVNLEGSPYLASAWAMSIAGSGSPIARATRPASPWPPCRSTMTAPCATAPYPSRIT